METETWKVVQYHGFQSIGYIQREYPEDNKVVTIEIGNEQDVYVVFYNDIRISSTSTDDVATDSGSVSIDPDFATFNYNPKQVTLTGNEFSYTYPKLLTTGKGSDGKTYVYTYGIREVSNPSGFEFESYDVGTNADDPTDGIKASNPDTEIIVKNKKTEEQTGSLKIRKTVTENSSNILSETAKSNLAGEYTFKIFTDASCETAYKVNDVPKTVSITIGNNGAAVTSEEITELPAGDYWIKETEPTNGSAPVINPVQVTVVAGKTGDESVIAEFTNNIETVDYEVTKTWGNGQRPPEGAEIQIKLQATVPATVEDPTATPEPVSVDLNSIGISPEMVKLNGGQKDGDEYTGDDTTDAPWKYEWTNLPKYDKDKKPINYSAVETSYKIGETTIDLGQYPASSSSEGTETNSLVITNQIPKTTVEGTKIWNVAGGVPTDNPTLTLTRKSSKPEAVSENVSVANGQPVWTDVEEKDGEKRYVFSDLDMYDSEGYRYTYEVTEASFKVGDTQYIVEKSEDGNSFVVMKDGTVVTTFVVTQEENNITNTETKDFEFTKIWRDMSQQDTTWPSDKKITVTFNAFTDDKDKALDDKTLIFSATENPPEGWVRTTSEDGKMTTFKTSELAVKNADGKELTYYVVETKVDGYNDPSYAFNNGTVTIKPDSATTKGKAVNGEYIINTPVGGYELPQTGGIGTTLFTALGGLMTVTAGAILTMRRGKRKTAES